MIGVEAWLSRSPQIADDLRRIGLPAEIGDQLKVLRLLNLLEERGAAPASSEVLADWVGPVLCSRSDQFPKLREALSKHFGQGSSPGLETAIATAGNIIGAEARKRFGLFWPALVVTGIIVAAIAGTLLLRDYVAELPRVIDPIQNSAPSPPAPAVSDHLTTIAVVLTLAFVVAFLLWRRMSLALRHGRVAGSAESYMIRTEQVLLDKDDSKFLSAARVLNRPKFKQTRQIDIATTVSETAAAGGRFSPSEIVKRLPANWLLLVERGGPEDPLPAFGNRLSTLLTRSGVRHSLYEFRRTPSWVRKDGPQGRHMPLETALATDRPTHVLLLAEASRAIDPRTGHTARWLIEHDLPPPVILLTPNARGDWTTTEAFAAQAGLMVLTADAEGLSTLAKRIQADELEPLPVSPGPETQFERWQAERFTWLSQRPPTDQTRDALINQLRSLLTEEEFCLLVGIAAFPEVRLDLLTTLDRRLRPEDTAAAQRERLLRIGRLVWVKEGVIPDWLREDLMRSLPATAVRELRERWMELLGDKPIPDTDSTQLTIHFSEGQSDPIGARTDGLFIGFISGKYDLPAPLRFVRLAGLWRAPDRLEVTVAGIGIALAVVVLANRFNLVAAAQHGLAAWMLAASNFQIWTQSFLPVSKAFWFGFAMAYFAALALLPVLPNSLITRLLLVPRAAVLSGLATFIPVYYLAMATSPAPTPPEVMATALRLVAPFCVAAISAAILWSPREESGQPGNLTITFERSRGTGITDFPTALFLLCLAIFAGTACLYFVDRDLWHLALLFGLVSLLGVARSLIASATGAVLQPAFTLPRSTIVAVGTGTLFGQLLGAICALSILTAPFVSHQEGMLHWAVLLGLSFFGAGAGLTFVVRRLGCTNGWTFYLYGLLYLGLHLLQAAFAERSPIGFPVFFFPIPESAILLALLWTSAKPINWFPYLTAIAGLTLPALAFSLVSTELGSAWLAFLSLLAPLATLWPLVQRVITQEPNPLYNPSGWRSGPVTQHLWAFTPLIYLTLIDIQWRYWTVDIRSLVLPLAIILPWRFGLRGFRTTILMVVPSLLIAFGTPQALFRAPDGIDLVSLDLATTSLLIALFVSRPHMIGALRATSKLSWQLTVALALILSVQVATVSVIPSYSSFFPADNVQDAPGSKLATKDYNSPQGGDAKSESFPSRGRQQVWTPSALPVFVLFFLGISSIKRRATIVPLCLLLAGALNFLPQILSLEQPLGDLLRPIEVTVAVCGVVAYAVGRTDQLQNRFPTLSVGLMVAMSIIISCSINFGIGRWAWSRDTVSELVLALLLAWFAGLLSSERLGRGASAAIQIIFGCAAGLTALAVLFPSTLIGNSSIPLIAPWLPLAAFVVGRRYPPEGALASPTVAFGQASEIALAQSGTRALGDFPFDETALVSRRGVRRKLARIADSASTAASAVPQPSTQTYKSSQSYNLARVNFATSRNVISTSSDTIEFGNEMSELSIGVAEVSIPVSHRLGQIEQPWSFAFFKPKPDPERHFAATTISILARDQVGSSLAGSAELLLFVPGFNEDFRHSLFRAAQLQNDLGIETVLYSWPSHNKVTSYVGDLDRARNSASHLTDLLAQLDRYTGHQLHLLGHGLGALILWESLLRISERRSGSVFGEVIFTAPDIDVDQARAQSHALSQIAQRVTMYVSEDDLALKATQFTTGPRIGSQVIALDGVDTIKYRNETMPRLKNPWSSNHLLADIRAIVKDHAGPERRFGIKPIGRTELVGPWELTV